MDFNLFGALGLARDRDKALDKTLIRLLGLLAAICVPAARLLFPEEAYDPMWMRWVIGGLALGVVTLSFASDWVFRHLNLLAILSLYLLNFWILYLATRNGFSPIYVINYFMVVFICNVFFNRVKDLLAYSILNLAGAILCSFLVAAPLFNPAIFLAYMIILSMISLGTLSYKIYYRQFLEDKKQNLQIISEAAFASSRDAIVALDPDGFILGFNEVFLDMWELDGKDLRQPERRISESEARHLIENMEEWKQSVKETRLDPKMETQFEIRRKDGRIIESYSKPFLKDGKVLGRIWYFLDVTEARIREAKLLKSRLQIEKQQEALVALITSPELSSGQEEFALEEIVRVAIETLTVDRAGIWLMEADQELCVCWKELSGESEKYSSGQSVSIPENQLYFEAIARERILGIEDLEKEPGRKDILRGLAHVESRALIEAPVRLAGNLKGLLILEQNTVRSWTQEEKHFAESLADLVTLSLEASERVRAERELANSLALLQATFDLSGVGILVNDLHSNILSTNELFLEIWKLDAATLKRLTNAELLRHNQSLLKVRSQTPAKIADLIQNPGQEDSSLLEFIDGRFVERFTRALEVEGKIVGRVWFYRDITQRTQASMALIDSEEKNSAILQAIPDLMIRINPDGRIIDHTAHPELIPGREAGSLAGALLPELLRAPDFSKDLLEKAQACFQSRQSLNFEAKLEGQSGMMDLEARLVPSGKSDVLVMIRDITQRKITEERLLQRNFELDSFVYRASHDLAAPLSSLVGLLDILKGEVFDPEILRYLGMMDTSILKLQTFIKNLTDFSRNERLEVAREEVDLQALIHESLENLGFIDHADRVETLIDIQQSHPLISDARRIGIVLENLLSNSLKYQDLQKPAPFIQIKAQIDSQQAQIEIEDNGMGIEAAHLPRIFDLFFRASTQAFGSGLGLYIARNTLVKLEGEIHCESEAGKGSTFHIRFPNLSEGKQETST